jgi:hypothetical protein
MSLTILLSALIPLAAERAPAPSPACFDARTTTQLRQLDDRTLLVAGGGKYHRIQTEAACPVAADSGAALLARDGWICGGEREFVQTGQQLCLISSAEALSARDYAQQARRSDLSGQGIDGEVMPAVEVRARLGSQRGFRGSPEYCVRPSLVRGWSADGEGILVQTSKRRSGGHGSYRIEFAGGCPDAAYLSNLRLKSGVGLDLVCGNPGDVAVLEADSSVSASIERISATPTLATARGCLIAAVYPADD